MRVRNTILAAAAIAASFVQLGAAAAPAFAQPTDAVEIVYQDLNLGHAAGRAALDRRISAAARQVCGTFLNIELKWDQMSRACQQEVIASVQPRRDALAGAPLYAQARASRAAN